MLPLAKQNNVVKRCRRHFPGPLFSFFRKAVCSFLSLNLLSSQGLSHVIIQDWGRNFGQKKSRITEILSKFPKTNNIVTQNRHCDSLQLESGDAGIDPMIQAGHLTRIR
jgi:hypothetical protein